MDDIFVIFVIIGLSLAFILIFRLLGAWMLRINEVIETLEKILEELKKQNATKEDN